MLSLALFLLLLSPTILIYVIFCPFFERKITGIKFQELVIIKIVSLAILFIPLFGGFVTLASATGNPNTTIWDIILILFLGASFCVPIIILHSWLHFAVKFYHGIGTQSRKESRKHFATVAVIGSIGVYLAIIIPFTLAKLFS